MNDNMTQEQEAQYIAALQREAVKFGLDPKNYDHLEATEKTLMQMEQFQIEKGDTAADVETKVTDKIGLAKQLRLDTKAYEQQRLEIKDEAVGTQKKANIRGMIAIAFSAAVAIGAAFLTNRTAKERAWGGWRWPANIGAFLAAGAGSAYLGFLTVAQPANKQMDTILGKLNEADAQFDEKIKPAMAQFFAQKITEGHAQAAAEQAKQQPAQAKTDQTPIEAQPAPAKTEAEIIADAQRKADIAKETQEGAEATYPSGKTLEGATPKSPMERVAPPGASHLDSVEQRKTAATTQQQHTMV